MDQCIYCNKPIPQARLDAMPGTQTCVEHSDEAPLVPVNFSTGSAGGGTKDANMNVVKDPGKGSLVRRAVMRGRFGAFGGKTASDNRSDAYWKGKAKG